MGSHEPDERAWVAVVGSYFAMLSARRDLLATDYHSCIDEALTDVDGADVALRLLAFLSAEQSLPHATQILTLTLRGEPYYSLAVKALKRLDANSLAHHLLGAIDRESLAREVRQHTAMLQSVLAAADQHEAARALQRSYGDG
jgi:hypothetical protein